MNKLILLVCLFKAFQSVGQNNSKEIELVNNDDTIIDTTKINNQHYIRFYRKAYTLPINLDFDNVIDTIVWYNYMEQSIERAEAFYDNGTQIMVHNKHGSIFYSGGLSFTDKKLKAYSDTITYKEDDFIVYSKLDSNVTGLILTHQLFGSDIEAYTIIGIEPFSKPKLLFDSNFILTSMEDLNGDGFRELIGKHENFGVSEYALTYVPFMVLTYKDSLLIDKQLTYDYNYQYKKYRDYPEASITLLTDEYLRKFTKEELGLMRNEIYADHGYVFKSKELNDHFLKKEWYRPKPNRSILLTDWEKINIETIQRIENKQFK